MRLAEWVTAQNQALAGVRQPEEAIRETLRELPSTLRGDPGRRSRAATGSRSVIGPGVGALIPTAQTFAPAQRALQSFLNQTVDPIENQIRPFTRQVRRPVKHLKQAAGPLGKTSNV